MSLLARRYRRCAGRGQCAPGTRAHSLRIPCARSRGAGGARPGAGGRYWSGEPEGSSPRGVAGEGTGARPRARGGLGFLSSEPPETESKPRLCPAAGRCSLLSSAPSRRREVSAEFSPPPQTAIQINNPPNNLICRSSPPACLPP